MNRERTTKDPGNPKLRQMTTRLMRGENLTRAEAGDFLNAMLNPAATDTQVAAGLAVLAAKGETVDELAGMAEAIKARAQTEPTPGRRSEISLPRGLSQALHRRLPAPSHQPRADRVRADLIRPWAAKLRPPICAQRPERNGGRFVFLRGRTFGLAFTSRAARAMVKEI